jgi:uracil-DNA glycosylase family 4
MIPKPNSCSGCPLYSSPHGKPYGFSHPSGTGKNGVMIIAEYLNRDEEMEGMVLTGKAGYQLFQQLARVGIERDDFYVHATLSCTPKDSKLIGLPYEKQAIEHCSPNLDSAIEFARKAAEAAGKTFTIVTLGVVPFKRVMGLESKRDSDLLKGDYYAYPFWSDKYRAWVFNTPHPAYLLRGKTHLWPIIQFVFKRALEVADGGLKLEEHDYLLDPTVNGFDDWISDYIASLVTDPDNPLSYDIETPYKKKKDEEELGKEEDADHTILRISFSYWADGRTHTVSVKWDAVFLAGIEKLFGTAKFVLGWNSTNYDYPRVSRHVRILGIDLDGMVAWHILNTSLPKSLGFVTPFYVQNTLMWKHLSEAQPAFYNAKDADMALRNYRSIKKDLIENRLWHVFERHVIEINKVLKYMTGIGVKLDLEERAIAEKQLQTLLDEIEVAMEEAVPQEARKLKVFKKTPKNVDGMIQVEGEVSTKQCDQCGSVGIVSKHTSSVGKKRLKIGEPENPCVGATIKKIKVMGMLWAQPLPFKVSKLGLTSYQKSLKHQAIIDRKEKKVTFNADALTILIKKYKNDKLYPRILEHRKVQKLLSTYVGVTGDNGRVVGGMPVGIDGRIHTTYTHNPSTLRFSSEDPNLQNLPRPNPKDKSDLVNIIRNLVVADKGNILYARDFSGIEAVLTGYFALDPKYIRLAKRDVHTYYTVYALYELEGGARIKGSDLPDLDWPDERLFPYLEQLKSEFKKERNSLYKHLVHAANFMQGAMGARDKIFSETGIEYPVATVKRVMDVYYSLFPKIKQWHKAILDETEKDGYLRNPFDYVHRFSKPYDYKKEFGEWTKKPGPDANKAIAFKPQSTAAGIIKEAMLRLYSDRFAEAGQFLRLQVHDELFFECPEGRWREIDVVVKEEMERPITQMPLPASWGMGDYLTVLTEEKKGYKWGEME